MTTAKRRGLTKYEIRFGDLFWGDRHIADGSGAFAIILITDSDENNPEETNILKHGELRSIQAYADKTQSALANLPPNIRSTCETLILPVHPAIIEEVNRCLETTGRAKNLKAFLTDLHQKHPEIAIHPLALVD